MMGHEWLTGVGLVLLGIITGFFGTNTGGSVFLTVPVMIWLGIPAQSSIATARLASVGTMVAGLRHFHTQGKVDYALAVPAAALGLAGALGGASLLLQIDPALLHKVIGALTLLLVALSLIKKPSGSETPPSAIRRLFGYILVMPVGMIGGLFGGQAKLSTYLFIIFFRKTISESVGTRKVGGLILSAGSLIIFGVNGIINWPYGGCLVIGTLLGADAGAKFALKKGDQWMESVFNTIVIALALRMLFW
ncbi:sulfite exporter TauE/SafE family protein [Pseudomonas sp. MPB26]|uniref:sulfite exporter TauE/SafE family protein n=1 Tax=Pseudomonas sp. MPB26 TaxID=3388491 RepID=UPI003984EF16